MMDSGCVVDNRAANQYYNLEWIYFVGKIWWQGFGIGYCMAVYSKDMELKVDKYCTTVNFEAMELIESEICLWNFNEAVWHLIIFIGINNFLLNW